MELLPESKKFKILQLSNAWDIPSGYGVQSKGTLFEWNKYYDVRQLAFYGNEGRMRDFQNPAENHPNWLKVYPQLPGDIHGDRTARLIFATSPWKPDLFVTLYDIWMGAYVDPANTPEGWEPIHPHWVPICVSADTQIYGTEDAVLSSNGLNEVSAVQSLPIFAPVYEIVTSEKKNLRITGDNPVWTKHGWKCAKNLKYGDMVYCNIGEPSERHGMGISSWIDRWRGKYLNSCLPQKSKKIHNSSKSPTQHIKHIERNDAMGRQKLWQETSEDESGICQRNEKSLSQKELQESISNICRRIYPSKIYSPKYDALFESQKKTRRTSNSFYRSSIRQAKEGLQSANRQDGLGIGTSTSETQWEQVIQRKTVTREVHRVFDLTTTNHNFFANGILIHNCMVDHDPIPESTLIQAKVAFRVVTPTLFGLKEFARNGVEAYYIPFGIDTEVFKPLKEKKKLKPWLGKRGFAFDTKKQTTFEENCFIIFMNGANKDPYRKGFMRMFQAIRIFLDQNPDAEKHTRVYVHSWMKQSRDIPHGAKTFKIQHLCKGTGDYHNLCSVPDMTLAKFYNAADVFMHLSEGGGFEIPILEALSCGVPVIGSDFVGMNELVAGHGWSIPMKTTYYSPLDAQQGIADEYKAAEALEDAYNNPEKREAFGKAGRQFALNFDWIKINPIWLKFFESIRREWQQVPIQERLI